MRFIVAVLLLGIAPSHADDSGAKAFAEEAAKRVEKKLSVRGDDEDWFFLTSELRHITTGQFWKQPWEDVAANQTNPLDSIVEFKGLLKDRGIELLLVPVPAKATVYPDKLSESFGPDAPFSTAPFLERIREAGVRVLDLESRFHTLRGKSETKLYCEQDAHFSPAAADLVAEWITEEMGWERQDSSKMIVSKTKELQIVGDLIEGSEWEGKVPPEILAMQQVLINNEPGIEPDNASSILLLGDSHTLVFHQGRSSGMHTTGAGVFDHLSHDVGFPLALVGVRGSGLVQARKQLFYTATSTEAFWESKRAVVWMFSVREFTQSTDRIIPIPLDRP